MNLFIPYQINRFKSWFWNIDRTGLTQTSFWNGSLNSETRSKQKTQWTVRTTVKPSGFENRGQFSRFQSKLEKKKKKKKLSTFYRLTEVDLHYCSFKHAVKHWDLRLHHSFFSFFFSILLSLVFFLSQYSSFSLLLLFLRSCLLCLPLFSLYFLFLPYHILNLTVKHSLYSWASILIR